LAIFKFPRKLLCRVKPAHLRPTVAARSSMYNLSRSCLFKNVIL
jgi:hypothetical protein